MIRSLILLILGIPATLWAQSGLVAKRLDKVQMTIPLSYNAYVENSINSALLNTHNSTSIVLGKSTVYLKQIEDSFSRNKLPIELRFLMPALSKYDNWLVSEDGGSGFWQMRYLVAKKYGLNISSYVDERREMFAATSASIKYLKELHLIYGDWLLVVAAFYADEVEVNKAIRMAGGKKDYWEIHRFLPVRYQNAVPDFIASVYIHSYYQMHNITPEAFKPALVESVPVTQWTTIFQISRALQMNYDSLKNLNPIYKKQVIPHTQKKYYINIPFEKVGRFYQLGDSVYTYGIMSKEDTVAEPKITIQTPIVQEPEVKPEPKENSSSQKLLYYTVKKGDFLGRIADLYDVNISEVRRWNNIKGDRININQRIKIYVPANEYAKYSKINSMSAYKKQQIIDKD